jgi:malonyl-CoA O-methyltransferase
VPAPTDEFFLDPRLVRRRADRASRTYDAAAAVQAEIRARLLERLDIVRLQPKSVLDLGAGTGQGTRALKDRYRTAEVVACDVSAGMLREAARQSRWLRPFHRVIGDAHRLPVASESIDLVFSNLLLEWCHDPDRVFAEMARALRVGGLLTFTTLGPDTLKELRTAWARADAAVHVHRFIDMHDLGDALLRTGFAEPVMDTERLTVTYASLDTLLTELRGSGATNLAAGRKRGLTTGRQLAALQKNVTGASAGRLSISVEVVYGHAWKGAPTRAASGETRVPLSSIRRRS